MFYAQTTSHTVTFYGMQPAAVGPLSLKAAASARVEVVHIAAALSVIPHDLESNAVGILKIELSSTT